MPLGGALGNGVGHEAAIGANAKALPNFHAAIPGLEGQRPVLVVLQRPFINLRLLRPVNHQTDKEGGARDRDKWTEDGVDH